MRSNEDYSILAWGLLRVSPDKNLLKNRDPDDGMSPVKWRSPWVLEYAQGPPYCKFWTKLLPTRSGYYSDMLGYTYDKELFVVVLSRVGVGILSLDPSVYGPGIPTYEQVSATFGEWTEYVALSKAPIWQGIPQSATDAILPLRNEVRDEATCRFKNCTMTISMKRKLDGWGFYMSTQITCSKFVLLDSAAALPSCPETEEIKQEMQIGRRAARSKACQDN